MVSSQADAIAKGLATSALAHRDVAVIASEVVRVAERRTKRVSVIDRFTPRWFGDWRAKVALRTVDREVAGASSQAEAVMARATSRLLTLGEPYGVESPFATGVMSAVTTNGPRGLHFDLICNAALAMVAARAASDEPRAVLEALGAAAIAGEGVAAATQRLAKQAERNAWWASVLSRTPLLQRVRWLQVKLRGHYTRREDEARLEAKRALVGVTNDVVARQASYDRGSGYHVGALDAVHPNAALLAGFEAGALAARGLVDGKGGAP